MRWFLYKYGKRSHRIIIGLGFFGRLPFNSITSSKFFQSLMQLEKSYRILAIALFIASSHFAFSQMGDQYDLKKLGKTVNSFYDDAAPVPTPDGKGLYYFIANHPDNKHGKNGSQDIWYCERDSLFAEWKQRVHLGSPFNNHQFNQVMSVSSGGKTLLIRGGKGAGDMNGLSILRKSGNSWSSSQELDIKELKEMNRGRFFGGFLSDDEKVLFLYFSEVLHTIKSDLYISFPLGKNKWTQPKRLPKPINTNQDEFGPFLMVDGKTLYFSSGKPGGMGGLDVYRTIRLDDSWEKWSEPENLGEPVNTRGFDAYFSTSEKGEVAFSTRAYKSADGGSLDMLEFVPRPPEVVFNLHVFDAETGQGLDSYVDFGRSEAETETYQTDYDGNNEFYIGTEYGDYHLNVNSHRYLSYTRDFRISKPKRDTVINMEIGLDHQEIHYYIAGILFESESLQPVDGELRFKNRNGKRAKVKTHHGQGRYEATLPGPGFYDILVNAENFLELIDSVEFDSALEDLHIPKDFFLTRLKKGLTVRLENIYFDFDKTNLREESFEELDKLRDLLEKYPKMEIEISGHTDSKGSDDYNLELSQGRADAVRSYLVENGISELRVISKGYGETVPLEDNDTEEGRQINRRVQFTVLEW
jgi:outer membrane protein OmpA-like peptidoglycan-associated protein